MKFVIGREARKTLVKLPRKTVERVIGKIEEVAADPAAPRTDVVKLRGREGCRLRVASGECFTKFEGTPRSY